MMSEKPPPRVVENGAPLWPVVLMAVIGSLVIYRVLDAVVPTDDTDNPAGGRSGLSVYVDHGTGCQYIGRFWHVTPRLDAAGKPMCGKGGG